MQLSQIIVRVHLQHPEFSEEELAELCYEYLAQFNEKTKEVTKEKSLKKYLSKEFGVIRDEAEDDGSHAQRSLAALPKHLFHYRNKKAVDYLLRIKGLYKQLGSTVLFEDAELNIKPEDKIALVGRNGVGKTTFLKMLLDPQQVDRGELLFAKGMKI